MKKQSVSLLGAVLLSISWVTSLGAQEINRDHPALGLAAKIAKPVIHYFNVAPAGILLANQVAILTMSVSGARSVTVTFSPCTPPDCSVPTYGYSSGTYFLNPSVTTTYTLRATNSAGTVVASQKVQIGKYLENPPPVPSGLTVKWGEACWYERDGQEFQAMPFDAQIPTPPGGLPIEATLYYGSTTCSPDSFTDNLNDFQTLVYSGGLFFFTNYPNFAESSAIWSLGNQSTGCVSYQEAPLCN
jgi:hypothetical protein